MKTATINELRGELENRTPKELRDLCLRLSKFKKENKEFLTYLLFESSDELSYIEGVKKDIDTQFEQVGTKNNYLMKKSVRRILLNTRKFIRYSHRKDTEIDLLIYFCKKLKKFIPSMHRNKALMKIYLRQIEEIRVKLTLLHEDLQFDYGLEVNDLKNMNDNI